MSRIGSRLELVSCWGVCAFVVAAFSASAAEMREPPQDVTTLRPTKKAPVIDGRLNDAAWKKATKITPFLRLRANVPAKVQTTAYLTFDSENLYVAFDCPFPEGERLKRHFRYRDDALFDDDECVEFWVDPLGSGCTSYHFGINPNGALIDGFHTHDKEFDAGWDATGAQVASHVEGARWCAELAIPFEDLGGRPAPDMLWRVNWARERRTREAQELSSSTGQFCRGAVFHYLRFDLRGKSPVMEVVSLGGLTKYHNFTGGNVLVVVVKDGADPLTASVSQQLGDKTTLAGEKTSVRNAKDVLLQVPYAVAGEKGERFVFQVRDASGKTLFEKTAAVHLGTTRFMPPPNPLYEELLSDEDPGLAAEGLPAWVDLIFVKGQTHFAKRYGVEVDAELAMRKYARHGLIPVNSQVMLYNAYRMPEFSRRFGARAVVWTTSCRATKSSRERHFFLEPALSQYKKSAWDIASKPHSWAVFWGDEHSAWVIKHMMRIYEGRGKREHQQYVRTELNEKVRQETGFRKYGLPQGTRDENPFRWIAWFRYANRESHRIWSELRAEIKKAHPHIRFMSEDSSGVIKPFEYSAGADMDICDFYNHQTGPSRMGHITKLLADLTGKEVFPCTHVEHYLGSFEPEQVRELLSEVFRAGGSGFVSYTTDSTGAETNLRTMEFSAPERWNAVLEIGDRVQNQPKLKYPEPECAVFYCNTSYQAINPYIQYWWDMDVQYAYEVFGPKVMRSWFRFVDENIILNHFEELAGLKVLMINFGKYQLPGVIEKLEEYAMKGGTVVCFDPEAFTWCADGTSLAEARKRVFGVEVGEPAERRETITFRDASLGVAGGTALPILALPYAVKAAPGTKVLATFSNGQPAIVEKTVGDGRALFFGFNPITSSAARNPEWKQTLRGMGKALGITLDQDLWRFTFPPFERELHPKDPDGVCLTNNYQRFINDLPASINNFASQGTYKLSPAPDAAPDEGGPGELPFSKGDLTDRRFAFALNEKPGPSTNYIVSWEANVPVEVVFDFKRAYPIKQVRLWYAKRLPRFSIFVSRDGRDWQEVGRRDTEQWTDGVRLVERTFAPHAVQFVKISFAERDARERYDKRQKKMVPWPQPFYLIEAEVWAEKQ